MRKLTVLLLLCFVSLRLDASCGSTNCPIETHALNVPSVGSVSFDLSYQYLDQDRPMIDTRLAKTGEVHTHADEIYTKNKVTTFSALWAPRPWLQLGASLPYIERDHFHLASSHHADGRIAAQHNTIPQRWDYAALGDLQLQGRFRMLQRLNGDALWLTSGVELPTGNHHLENAAALEAEPMLQPGSGSTDGTLGLTYLGGILGESGRRGPLGRIALLPYFATASMRVNGRDASGYALGNELQLSAGTAYPLPANFDLLLQLNGRIQQRDRARAAEDLEDAAFTGGKRLYVSPGVRYSLPGGAAAYALVQIPLYQQVNGLQLTTPYNIVAGLQLRR